MYSIMWLILVVAFSIIEISTFNLVTIWFASGALVAMIVSLFNIDFVWQMWIFIIVSAVTLILTKPLIKKKLNIKKTETNADRVIGKTGIVTDDISSDKFAGEVKVNGQTWSAVSENEEIIPKDSKVKIIRIEGVKLVVEKIN